MTVGLTPIQTRIWQFILAHIAEHDVFPVYAEMQAGLGYASKSRIFDLLQELQQRGLIERVTQRQCARPYRIKSPRNHPNDAERQRIYQEGFEAGVKFGMQQERERASVAPAGPGTDGAGEYLRAK
jgi:SOS-response transcriptional repressor LexA